MFPVNRFYYAIDMWQGSDRGYKKASAVVTTDAR